jgi:DNA-directed RNA polymerase subunit RPC12/RpoP
MNEFDDEYIKKFQGGVKLACQHCGYKWRYKGSNPHMATCPHCHYGVRVKKNIIKNGEMKECVQKE